MIHVIPVGGDEPIHTAAETCWCLPLSQDGVWIHHAHDCRERFERQGVTHWDKKWVLVEDGTPKFP